MEYNFSEDLKSIREILGFSQSELAEKIGVEQVTISRTELKKTEPSARLLEAVYSFAFDKNIKINKLKEMFWRDDLGANEKLLFHGAKTEIDGEIDIHKGRKNNDFGQGFYLTTSKELAESFLRTSIAKAIATGTIEEGQKFGYISTFEFNLSGNLETHIFENADVDWLHCIAAHRKKKMFIEVEREMARYDIIAGKIADDATNATLTAYLAGVFGTAGDKEADDFCIRQLLPNKLKDQYCFKTESAIECLKFVKGEKIWLK